MYWTGDSEEKFSEKKKKWLRNVKLDSNKCNSFGGKFIWFFNEDNFISWNYK